MSILAESGASVIQKGTRLYSAECLTRTNLHLEVNEKNVCLESNLIITFQPMSIYCCHPDTPAEFLVSSLMSFILNNHRRCSGSADPSLTTFQEITSPLLGQQQGEPQRFFSVMGEPPGKAQRMMDFLHIRKRDTSH